MDFPLMVRGNLVIIDATNPRYANAAETVIDLDLTVADAERGSVSLSFTAIANDTEEHGRLLHAYAESLGPTPFAVDPVRQKQSIAARRYDEEISGIVFNGIAVDTGRDSQGLITGATLASVLDPSYICNWKTSSGFVELDATALAAVSQAVRAHVQACFDREAELLTALAASTFTDSMLDEGWPE